MKLKDGSLKGIFFNLIEDKAMDIVSKRVSKMNGDVRVAFDVIKSCFTELFNKVRDSPTLLKDLEIFVSMDMVLKVFADKYGSKLPETLRSLPR
jgi:hypothetical protein